jgi:hypothetical protein
MAWPKPRLGTIIIKKKTTFMYVFIDIFMFKQITFAAYLSKSKQLQRYLSTILKF